MSHDAVEKNVSSHDDDGTVNLKIVNGHYVGHGVGKHHAFDGSCMVANDADVVGIHDHDGIRRLVVDAVLNSSAEIDSRAYLRFSPDGVVG